MARDDYGRGDSTGAWARRDREYPEHQEPGREQQGRWSAGGRPGHFGFGGNASGYGRGGALDLGYGAFDVGGHDGDWGIGGTRGPIGQPGGWSGGWSVGESGRPGWRGAGPGFESQARRGDVPPDIRGWQEPGGQRGEWRPIDRGARDRWRDHADRGYDPANERGAAHGPVRPEDDPHGWADENLYGGRQALSQPGPYHGGYLTMERLGRDEEIGGSFSTEGFNAGAEGPQSEQRAAAMHGSASLIGYSEASLGRPRFGGEPARPSYAGRGPRGYRRPDDRIREDVCEALTHHPGIDATDIDVAVEDGEVSLSGTVDDRHARRLAEDIAERCAGVHDVHNRLRVGDLGERGRGGEDDSPYRSA